MWARCPACGRGHKLAGKYARPVRKDRVPGCTYCDPQIGSVGLTEAQAKEKGYQVKVGKFPFVGNSKATIVDSHDGFVKVVSTRSTARFSASTSSARRRPS